MDAQDFKARRTEMKLTQAALAAELGVTEATIANYESGRSDVPRTTELAIAELVRRKRETKPEKTPADWKGEWSVFSDVERVAFERMVKHRPSDDMLMVSIEDHLDAVQNWKRYCIAWQQAHDQLEEHRIAFQKALPDLKEKFR